MKKLALILLASACAHAPVQTLDLSKLDDHEKRINWLEHKYELPREEPIVPHVGVYRASFEPRQLPSLLLGQPRPPAASGLPFTPRSLNLPIYTGDDVGLICFNTGLACSVTNGQVIIYHDGTNLNMYAGGANRITISNGTGVITLNGPLTIANSPITTISADDPMLYASSSNSTFQLSTNISAANAGAATTTAAFTFFPQNALDTDDWVFNIGNVNNGSSLLSLTYGGDLTLGANGDIRVQSTGVVYLDGNGGRKYMYGGDARGVTFGVLGGGTNHGLVASAMIETNTTAVGNVGASGPDNLQSFTLDGSEFNVARCLLITATGSTANNANAKTVALVFGTTTLATKQLIASVAGTWQLQAKVCRTGVSTQDYYVVSENNNGTAVCGTAACADGATIFRRAAFGSMTETETNALTIKTQSTVSTADNDIVSELLTIEVI